MVGIISPNAINAIHRKSVIAANNWQTNLIWGWKNKCHMSILKKNKGSAMRVVKIPIEKIYVPAGKKKTLDEEKIMPLAEDILENGHLTPILSLIHI